MNEVCSPYHFGVFCSLGIKGKVVELHSKFESILAAILDVLWKNYLNDLEWLSHMFLWQFYSPLPILLARVKEWIGLVFYQDSTGLRTKGTFATLQKPASMYIKYPSSSSQNELSRGVSAKFAVSTAMLSCIFLLIFILRSKMCVYEQSCNWM